MADFFEFGSAEFHTFVPPTSSLPGFLTLAVYDHIRGAFTNLVDSAQGYKKQFPALSDL